MRLDLAVTTSQRELSNEGLLMLSFRLYLTDIDTSCWSWTTDRWVCGRSWIKPLANPTLVSQLACDQSGRASLFVRECNDGIQRPRVEPATQTLSNAGSLISGMSGWQVDFVTVELQPGAIRIAVGEHGTAPLYLATGRGMLAGSWNLPELREFFDPSDLLERAVVRALTRQPRYTSDTLFRGVKQLTERAMATFTRHGLEIAYPEPAHHVLAARQPRAGVDLVAAFHELLTVVTTAVAAGPGDVGVELSGGADSANVALAVSTVRDDAVRSYGLVVDGKVGMQQRIRRDVLVRRLGFTDVAISAGVHPPFAPDGVRALGLPHDPCSAYYREAFDRMRDVVAEHETRVIFTGLGGDELNALHPHERPGDSTPAEYHSIPWLGSRVHAAMADVDTNLAPVSAVPLPTLMAFRLHHPAYLAAGIWPKAPLAHPMIGRFAEQLPLELRKGKSLFRERLRRAGFANEIADPRRPENFRALMQHGLRRYGMPMLERMLEESTLTDAGYLDRRALHAAWQAAKTAEPIPSILCDAIAVERGVQTLRNAAHPAAATID